MYNTNEFWKKAKKRFTKRLENIDQEKLDLVQDFIKNTKDDWNYILPTELKKKLNKDPKKFYLLDTRAKEAFKEGHIKGAMNIFWLDLFKEENLAKLPKDKTIVCICYVGHTASQVMTLLKILGYKTVGLKYGMGISPTEGVPIAGWTDYGFGVVK